MIRLAGRGCARSGSLQGECGPGVALVAASDSPETRQKLMKRARSGCLAAVASAADGYGGVEGAVSGCACGFYMRSQRMAASFAVPAVPRQEGSRRANMSMRRRTPLAMAIMDRA